MKHFYFTNPTKDRHKARELQLLLEKELHGILTLSNPFYDVAGQPTEEIGYLDKGLEPQVEPGTIIHNDLKQIRDLDGIIAWITENTSWGSICETFFSSYVLGKPTYLIFDPATRNNVNNPDHPWPRGNSTRIFGSYEAFIAFAKEKLRE